MSSLTAVMSRRIFSAAIVPVRVYSQTSRLLRIFFASFKDDVAVGQHVHDGRADAIADALGVGAAAVGLEAHAGFEIHAGLTGGAEYEPAEVVEPQGIR